MMAIEREKKILELLGSGAKLSQQALAQKFQVSVNTIRNDFKSLEEKGLAITVRGGVLPAYHPELFRRMQQNRAVKNMIARKAASLIQNYDTIMISCGTTCASIGRYLYGKTGINLITHSTLLLPSVRTNPNINMHLTGGEFLPEEEATVGTMVIDELERFYPRLAIVGSDRFSMESGITTRSLKAALVLRTMLKQAQYKVLVVESQKFGSARFVKIASLDEIDIIITDSGLDVKVQKLFKENKIEVMLVE